MKGFEELRAVEMARHHLPPFLVSLGLLVRITALILAIIILVLNTTLNLDLDWIAVSSGSLSIFS